MLYSIIMIVFEVFCFSASSILPDRMLECKLYCMQRFVVLMAQSHQKLWSNKLELSAKPASVL